MTIFSEVMVILVVRDHEHVLGDTLAYSKQWMPWQQ